MSEDDGVKIVVVGPTQSGKTCLAAGLFSISTSDFTIEPANTAGIPLRVRFFGF